MKTLLLLAVLLMGASLQALAADQTFTFTPSSASAGTLSGAPTGVTATFKNTYNSANQVTSNNSMTLTIAGLASDVTIKGITIHAKTNTSKGAGTATATMNGTEFGSYTYTVIGTTYTDKELTVTPTIASGDLVVTISCTTNSVYCDKFTFTYEEAGASTLANPELTIDDVELVEDDMVNLVYSTKSDGAITFTSASPSVAEVDKDGIVYAYKAGTAKITATQAATEEYQSATVTFNVIVTKAPRVKPYNEVFYESFDDCASVGGNDNGWSSINPTGTIQTDNDCWTFDGGAAASQCAKFGTGKAGGSAKATLTLDAGVYTLSFKAGAWNGNSEGTTLNLSAAGATLDRESITMEKGEFNDYTATLTVAETGEVSFTFSTSAGNNRFFLDEVTLNIDHLTATVQSYGWATYIPAYDVEFAEGDAFVVTQASVADGLTVEAVTSVPAKTPVLLKGEGTKSITLLATAPAAPTNLLEVSDGTVASDKYAYVLAKDGDGACFKQWTGEASVLNGRAVLLLDEEVAEARSVFALGGETTGIAEIEKGKLKIENSVYDQQGRRVGQSSIFNSQSSILKKGLYIVNGKKVMVK